MELKISDSEHLSILQEGYSYHLSYSYRPRVYLFKIEQEFDNTHYWAGSRPYQGFAPSTNGNIIYTIFKNLTHNGIAMVDLESDKVKILTKEAIL